MMCSSDGDFWFMDDDQPIPLPFLSDQTMPPNLNADDLEIIDLLADDINHGNDLADSPTVDIQNGIDGLDEAPLQLSDINLSDLIDSLTAFPSNDTVHENSPPAVENPNKSFVVKSSNPMNTTNFIAGGEFIHTGQSLQLAISPSLYQRARYEGELEEVLRYIFLPNNASLTLTMSDLRSNIAYDISFVLRITRTTIPYGTDQRILCHPYPIWLNDKNGKVYNSSLFIPITGETMKIDHLIMQRLKQNVLGGITQFPVFTSDQLDFNDIHSINTNKAKDIIEKYQLQYSILHFQIFLVDQYNRAYPTDMKCQTEPIYEYEGKELKSLPQDVRKAQKQSIKRKKIGQIKKSSIKINKNKMGKKTVCC